VAIYKVDEIKVRRPALGEGVQDAASKAEAGANFQSEGVGEESEQSHINAIDYT